MEFLSVQKINRISVTDALASDMETIITQAKALDLDSQDMHFGQFVIARNEQVIVGFGRIKKYDDCVEISTVGVIPHQQRMGIGTLVVNALLSKINGEVYVISVIPEYFSRFGFVTSKEFPKVLLDKCNFCHSFGFKEGEVFVMKYTTNREVDVKTSLHD